MKTLETLFHVLDNQSEKVDAWFKNKWSDHKPLPYFSCDVRHAGYKIGVVDTNLFAAGFNNLCSSFSKKVSSAFDDYFENYFPKAKTIILLAENHTRNKFYLLNIYHLKTLIEKTGRDCLVTLMLEDFPKDEIEIPLEPEKTLTIYKPTIQNNQLYIKNEKACLVISNNDFSSGLIPTWQNLETPILPQPNLGWLNRKKSQHFDILNTLCREFTNEFDLNPWQISPLHKVIQNITSDNLESLAKSVDELLADVQKHYDNANISETPYCFVKNDSGTYGLGVVSVNSGQELLNLNRKKRNKLFAKKGESSNSQFLIQEGIPTVDTYSSFPIEPVMYGVGKNPVAGFFRFHAAKNPYESLNSPGMDFSCLCLHKLDEPHESDFINCKSKRALVNGSMFLAKLAALAAAYEQDL